MSSCGAGKLLSWRDFRVEEEVRRVRMDFKCIALVILREPGGQHEL
jgi:hypothetical protein